MPPLLKNLLGNGEKDRELVEELRTLLRELQEERRRCELLKETTTAAAGRLEQLNEPISKARLSRRSISGPRASRISPDVAMSRRWTINASG